MKKEDKKRGDCLKLQRGIFRSIDPLLAYARREAVVKHPLYPVYTGEQSSLKKKGILSDFFLDHIAFSLYPV